MAFDRCSPFFCGIRRRLVTAVSTFDVSFLATIALPGLILGVVLGLFEKRARDSAHARTDYGFEIEENEENQQCKNTALLVHKIEKELAPAANFNPSGITISPPTPSAKTVESADSSTVPVPGPAPNQS